MKAQIRGEKVKLFDFTSSTQLQIEIQIDSSFEIDITCFRLNEEKKLIDDRYMIFYRDNAVKRLIGGNNFFSKN